MHGNSKQNRTGKARRSAAVKAAKAIDALTKLSLNYREPSESGNAFNDVRHGIERGDTSENPICVDDFEWSSEDSDHDDNITLAAETCSTVSTEHEGISMDEDEIVDVDELEDEDERFRATLPSSSPSSSRKRAYVPSPSISPEPCYKNSRLDPLPDVSVSLLEEDTVINYDEYYEASIPDEMNDCSSARCSSEDSETLRQIDSTSSRSYERPILEPTSRFPLTRESTIMSDKFFSIPVGQKELWHDPSLEDTFDEESVEYRLDHDSPHPSLRPSLEKLPLQAYIGEDTLRWHADRDHQSLDFRETVIASETGDQDFLLEGGVEAAAEMFRRLEVQAPSNLEELVERRNRNKQKV